MDLIELGQALRERREAIGLSMGAVARSIGVSDGYVSMVERAVPRQNGRPSRPGEDLLRTWARALGWEESDTRDRPFVHQLLALAGYRTSSGPQHPGVPFSHAPGTMHFPSPPRLQRRVARERLHAALDQFLDELKPNEWQEAEDLLQELLAWMQFRFGKRREGFVEH